MKTKFFERTYLFTLMIFLLFLDVSVIFLCIFTFRNNMSATEKACASESFAISEAYGADAKDLGVESAYIIQLSYCNFYSERNIFLRFEGNGAESLSTLPEGLIIPGVGNIASDSVNGKYYVLITDETDDGVYKITYAKDVTEVYGKFRTVAAWTIGASALVSICLAIVLYAVLHKLYSPLNKLRLATERISNGDLSARADDKGNDELSCLARDFNSMASRVEEQIDELKTVADQKQRMLDDLAHEMRTPLTVIHGYAEFIAGANISRDEQIDASRYIMKEAMRLKSVSEALLDSAFIREGSVIKEKISARSLICDTAERFKVKASSAEVEIGICEFEDIYIDAEKTLIELALANLTDNAVNACRKGGKIELGCLDDGEYITLYVKDNGIGMNEEQLKHIKEPFYRADKARTRSRGGTGLGLALCDAICVAHGASLDFESREGEGTVACIKFLKSYNFITNQ